MSDLQEQLEGKEKADMAGQRAIMVCSHVKYVHAIFCCPCKVVAVFEVVFGNRCNLLPKILLAEPVM